MMSEVGPTFVRDRTENSFNIDFDHLSIPELIDLAKEFGVNKLGAIYISPKGGDEQEEDVASGEDVVENFTSDVEHSSSEEDVEHSSSEEDVEHSSSEEDVVNESDSELSDDYGSDVHEEFIIVRKDLREYNKNKAVNAAAKEKVDEFLGEAGVDKIMKTLNFRDKLEGDDDKPYYVSTDVDNFATESECEAVSDDNEVDKE
ncbi:hypothetical protein K7X08_008064 [Anisodus acutangulus]|uniref:Uncharacterized protein n=1 Tax=Anisodus acutangulus TaxID=402998 RepID=A0A9Q1MQE3_9SOLA|nr:hypothetical protein K7X08_008064 [Anisodus acutangulus]